MSAMQKLRRPLERLWIVLVIVPVAAVGALVIYRFHGVFGSEGAAVGGNSGGEIVSTVPKYVTYELYGPEGSSGMVSYVDERAQPQEATFHSLPWSLTLTTTLPSVYANVMAQGDGHELGCRITVNGELRDEQQTDGHDAATFCVVKAA
ncbi:MmpS family transport accessory protein [[Mycobacterium] nativiensis]|uniref:MmpS family transport accessory protein n=1 Tax=[Mycobacterium] nativiensis TaxID=2855503 RepID=A0ABU5Y078_9MYCO|nr:MmpS family transport accessory protein [Mycolicibacter sp. MYC340]MEB3033660.1 MmpS family transport accessory protein [Mycolicibacter sp. MYC340]